MSNAISVTLCGLRRSAWLSLAASAVLVACGGDDSPSASAPISGAGTRMHALAVAVNPGSWVTVTQPVDALLQSLNIPADAPTRGMWSAVGTWPMVGVNQAVLPDGKVLTWGTSPDGGAQNGRYFDLWDPARGLADAGSHNLTYDATRQDSFCAPAVYAADGRLMITGGNGTNTNGTTSQYYTPSGGAFAQGPSVADARWYAAMITLPDGRPIVLGGINPYTEDQWTNPDQAVTQGLSSMTPEVLENGNWRSLLGAQSRTAFGPDFLRASLPKVWVAPDGRVFGIGTEQMYYVDPNAAGGQGTTTVVGAYKTAPNASATNDTAPNVGPTMSAVMFAPGKVLTVGGNAYHNGMGYMASRMATLIDLNGGGAVMTEQPTMAYPRNFANTIVLPNGKVLVTGGETQANNDPALGVFAAEQWDPATGTWSTLASAAVFRGYHSQTSLLTNGTVLSTGGGNPGPVQLKGEVFYPPYLFKAVNGTAQLAPRPQMVGISGLSYASAASMQFDMADGSPISQVALIGLSVGTHSFNSGQRRIPLTFTQDGIRITATLPQATIAPPGYYQLIALDANGVPSRGTVIAVGQGVNPPPITVTPYNPPNVSAVIAAPAIASGGNASYTLSAATGVSYSWAFGDGSAATAFSTTASATHAFASAGVYGVTLTAKAADGSTSTRSFLQAVYAPVTAGKPVASSATALETRANASARLWVANPDADTVAVIDTATNTTVAEIGVGTSPRSVAVAPDGRIWVTNKATSSISIVSPSTLSVVATVALPRGAQPHGLVFAPGGSAYVVVEATGQLLKLDPGTGAVQATLAVGNSPRFVSATADGTMVFVSRFITNLLPGESTASVNTTTAGADVLAVNAGAMTLAKTIVLRHSDKVDNEVQGSGIPNYLAAAVVSPDGKSAWVPSKQDNIKRGTLRNGQGLNFQNAVRGISSRIDLPTLTEDYARRIDHDNSSLGTAAAFHPMGAYLFVALETSRQVAVVDAVGGRELVKVDVGRAPQALTVSNDGTKLYVQNFMDRTVSVLDLTPLVNQGLLTLPLMATVSTVGAEKLSAQVLLGKQLFYDARDPRLARDSYMSCASCHSDAGHDGRTWDFTGFGEGLRNTPSLKGRAGMGHGFVHWSANFDEVQDFEGQIRNFAGGTGLMTDAQFNTGTRNTPLGDKKAGVSADLDALASYLGSLASVDSSPYRNADGTLTPAATAGKAVFANANCASCHGGPGFTISADASTLKNIGTIKGTSGQRLGGTLTGIDVPTLRDVWRTGPYLHDGSAATLAVAVQAHNGNTVTGTNLGNLVAYLQQIGAEEGSLAGAWGFNEGTGGTAADTSGANRTMTLANTTWAAGKVGQALQFNGTNASASTASAVIDTSKSFSVAVWVRLDALTGWRTMVNQDGVNISGFWLQFSDAVGSKFLLTMHDVDNVASNAYRAVGTTTPVAGQWYHVVGVRDLTAGVIKIYVNGKLEGTTAYAGGWAANGTMNVGRGKWGGAQNDWVAGAVDEVKAYAVALTDADVSQLYSQVVPASTPAATAVACANEGGACALPSGATATVWFGANGNWAAKPGVTGSIACTNAVFGDPAPGVTKACRYLVTAVANLAPTVSLTAPANNASVVQGTAITLSASAADSDGAIAKVAFYDGATLLATTTTAPYSFAWGNAWAGAHTLTAKATDDVGAVTTSAVVNLTVAAPAKPLATATTCAKEGGTCAIPAGLTATVWYGANTTWAVKTGVKGSIACTNAVFGNLWYVTGKTCRYQ